MRFDREISEKVTPAAARDISLLQSGVSPTTVALGALREANLSPDQIKQLAEIVQKARQAGQLGPMEPLHAKVNGIDIQVRWDAGYGDYVVHLPQIFVGSDRAKESGVVDEILRVSDCAETAKSVFKKATELASTAVDAYALMKQLSEIPFTLVDIS